MLDDFKMITHSFPDEIKIIPLADLHYGALTFNMKKWKEFKEYVLSQDDVYLCLVGDMIENQTKNTHAPFDQMVRPSEQKKWMIEELRPLVELNKILCVTSGNHEKRKDNTACDNDVMYDICSVLGIEDRYRPNMVFMKVQIGNRNDYNRQAYTFGVTHGSGGGAQTGSAVNKNEKFGYVFDGLDCLITGHTHKPVLSKPSKIVLDPKNNKISEKPFWQVIASSWLGYGGYALRGQMTPSSFMEQEITLTKQKVKRLEINVK